jgi:serine/threonine-protein phosphatase 2A catalytic subunit
MHARPADPFCSLAVWCCCCCPRCGNKAALVDIDEHMQHKIVQFDHAPPKGAGITEVKRTVPDYFL